MNRKQIRRLIFIIVLILFSFTFFSAGAEGVELRSLLTGEINTALSVGLSAPSYENLAQFGEERLNSLNALLKYLSITLTLDGQTTETTVAIAEQAVFSLTEIDSEQGTYLYCRF